MLEQLNPVIILGGNINGLGIVRSFQKTDISVYVFIQQKDFITHSHFCKTVMCPDPKSDDFEGFLYQYCKGMTNKPVIFATADVFLIPLIRNKKKLEEVAYIPTCDQELFDKLIEKKYLYQFAEQVGVACPKTKNLLAEEIDMTITDGMLYPLIVKPSVNITFQKTFGQKALLMDNPKDMRQFISEVQNKKYVGPLIIQEYIPGDMTTLHTITSYADRNSEIRGYSIGHKIRQYPARTGTITAGLVEHVEDILDMSKRFVKAVGFYGISNIEYKYDERDGLYKLMEINPRTGLWNLSVLESGVNLPLMAYRDILGETISDECDKEKKLIWAITLFDLLVSLRGYKANGEAEYALSYKAWRRSLSGTRKVDAIFRWNDPMPSIVHAFSLLLYSMKKVFKK